MNEYGLAVGTADDGNIDGDGIAIRTGCRILDIVDRAPHVIGIALKVGGACQDRPGVSAVIRHCWFRERVRVKDVVILKHEEYGRSARINEGPYWIRRRISSIRTCSP